MSPSIVVLGAGPGLGQAVARRYADGGYRLVLVGRRRPPLEGLAAELTTSGSQAYAVTADLSAPQGAARLASEIRQHVGEPNVVYYGLTPGRTGSAESAQPIRPSQLTPDVVESYLPTAVYTLTELVRQFLPGMLARGDGALLAAGGFSAVRGVPYFAAAGPALAAQRNYLQSLESELKDTGVFVGRLYVGATIKNSAWHKRLEQEQAAGRSIPSGNTIVDPTQLAEALWTMHHVSKQAEVVVPEGLSA